ncbi:MAG: hypothetical protein ACREDE_01560 [Thermoplasmata archaeon]
MVAAARVDLLLFVAGEPDPGIPSPRDVTLSMGARIWGSLVPVGLVTKPGTGPLYSAESALPPPSKPVAWRLPPQQIHCMQAVLDAARREGRTVTVVDVDRSAGRRDLVDRWVGSDDVLPLLVRPDGSRLEGLENFSPRKLRQFIHGS